MTNINRKSYNISGKMIINLDTKKIQVIIETKDTDKKNILNKVTKNLEKSYKNWNFENFSNFKFVEIPFFAKGTTYGNIKRKIRNKTYYNLLKSPTLEFIVEKSADKQITAEELSLSTQDYNEGVNAFKNGDYEKAIEYFNQSYQHYKYNLEALYSKAAAYYELGNIEETCKTLKVLTNLGQVKARKQIEHYCNTD